MLGLLHGGLARLRRRADDSGFDGEPARDLVRLAFDPRPLDGLLVVAAPERYFPAAEDHDDIAFGNVAVTAHAHLGGLFGNRRGHHALHLVARTLSSRGAQVAPRPHRAQLELRAGAILCTNQNWKNISRIFRADSRLGVFEATQTNDRPKAAAPARSFWSVGHYCLRM